MKAKVMYHLDHALSKHINLKKEAIYPRIIIDPALLDGSLDPTHTENH
ncbi:hypothetical protein [Peribacillus simplex]|uniref:Uncharacterized protein n=1 Tax=Peribacillus simplex TaxID=1478 RepID=A0AAW7IR64_9BACI|nr:hypothetical protein [Peribacillus simplex]MDM5454271.1 hypothetical protein [Peribacillus simplex]